MRWLTLALVAVVGLAAGYLCIRERPQNEVAVVGPPTTIALEPPGGKVVNGLRLVLCADRRELVLRPDGTGAEPINLRLSVVNASGQPIKLRHSSLISLWNDLQLEVTGPDADSVRVDEKRATALASAGFARNLSPREECEAPVLQFPGEVPQDQMVDGERVVSRTYRLLRPGNYSIRVRYENYRTDEPKIIESSWTGTMTSNNLVFTVRTTNAHRR